MSERRLRPPLLALLPPLVLACAPPSPAATPAPPPSPCPTSVAATPTPVPAPVAPAPFDPTPWLDDFHALLAEMSSHYANLEWAVNERKMDLPALRAKTEARLRDAERVKNDDDAKRVLKSFVDAFGDAHFTIQWAGPSPGSTPTEDTAAAAGPLCARLGFGKETPKPGVDFALASPGALQWTPIADADSSDLPGGIVRLKSGVKLGTIRIGLFMEQLHPAMCEAARHDLGLADDAPCDDACKDRLLMNVSDRMTASLERRAASLAHAGVAAVVVDITGNGGGSSWVEPAARALTPLPLRAPRMGFVRHEHWVKQLGESLDNIAKDRATVGKRTAKDDAILATAEATLRAALEEARTPCDRSALWEAGKPKPACAQLVTNRFFTSGVLPYAKAGSFEGWASRDALYSPRQYAYHEGALSLPLIVLVDGGTASASEQFAAMLADNHAALLVGSLTTGCGCGFTNGGIPTTLPHSGAHVRIPDCARLRADGANEASGLVPDVLLPLATRDSPYQRAMKIAAGLETAVKRLGSANLPPRRPSRD